MLEIITAFLFVIFYCFLLAYTCAHIEAIYDKPNLAWITFVIGVVLLIMGGIFLSDSLSSKQSTQYKQIEQPVYYKVK